MGGSTSKGGEERKTTGKLLRRGNSPSIWRRRPNRKSPIGEREKVRPGMVRGK